MQLRTVSILWIITLPLTLEHWSLYAGFGSEEEGL